MATPQAASVPSPAPPAAAKSKKGLFIGIVLAIVGLAGGGGAAYWAFAGGGKATAAAHDPKASDDAEASAPAADETLGLVAFEPFLVNLAGDEGRAYLRVTLQLLVASEAQAKELSGAAVLRTRLRSSILEVLSTQSAAKLVTPEGKTELKRLIAEQIGSVTSQVSVRDVLFSDFVVQY